MKSGGSSKKGSSFERGVLSKLSLWVSGGDRKDLYRRSILSGGRTTIALKEGSSEFSSQAGDASLACPSHDVACRFLEVFLTEFKHYKNIHFESLVFEIPKDSSIYSFWLKLKDQSRQLRKLPFLVARQNYKKDILILNSAGVQVLDIGFTVVAYYRKLDANLFFFDEFLEADVNKTCLIYSNK